MFKTGTVTVGIPTLAATILALVAGVLQAVNFYVIDASSQLHASIAIGLYFLMSAGIVPLTGASFRAALHLPPWANIVASALLGSALLALTTINMSTALHGAIAIVISVFSALGFNADVVPVSPVTPAPAGK